MILRWKVSQVETSQTPKIKVKCHKEFTFANGSFRYLAGTIQTFAGNNFRRFYGHHVTMATMRLKNQRPLISDKTIFKNFSWADTSSNIREAREFRRFRRFHISRMPDNYDFCVYKYYTKDKKLENFSSHKTSYQ